MTLRDALVRSKNVPTVHLAQAVGLDEVVGAARRAGIGERLPELPAMALGTVAVSPLELTSAYTAFAALGTAAEPRFVISVEDEKGRVLWRPPAPRGQRGALDPRVAFLVTDVLREALRRGTGTAALPAGLDLPAAGKTGTTNDGADVWFVGYTPDRAASLWIGFDQPRPILADATGGRLAAPAWGRLMARAYAGRPLPAPWQRPAGVVERRVDPATGLLLAGDCAPLSGEPRRELFLTGVEPAAYCPGREPPPSNGFPVDRLNARRTQLAAEERRLAEREAALRQAEQAQQQKAAEREAEQEKLAAKARQDAEAEHAAEQAAQKAAERQAQRAEQRKAAERQAKETERRQEQERLAAKAKRDAEARRDAEAKQAAAERASLARRAAAADAAARQRAEREARLAAKEKELDEREAELRRTEQVERRAAARRPADDPESDTEERPAQHETEAQVEDAGSDLSGWWELTNRIETTSYPAYQGLRLGYRLQLEQDGDRITGRGQKWSEDGRTLGAAGRTPITVRGTVDGRTVHLRFTEQGARRATAGAFDWQLSADRDALRGSFWSDAAGARGSSVAHRMR